jgi:hypothetical protein
LIAEHFPSSIAGGDVTKVIGLILDNTKANLSALRQLEAKYTHLITLGSQASQSGRDACLFLIHPLPCLVM